jgi:hypothetical protein
MDAYAKKIGLCVLETAWLDTAEARVRGMPRRGELSYAVEGRKMTLAASLN